MDRSGLQRLVPIVLVLIVIAVAVTALISLGRTFFGGSSSPIQVNTGKQSLTNVDADRSVRMTVRGPIVASENFHSYTITASNDSRVMTTYKGYIGGQVDNEQLPNDTQAYEQFVYALDNDKLMDATPLTGDANDIRGLCPTGTLIQFDVLQGGNSVQMLWTTTCANAKGSLKATASIVRRLFQAQIPDFDKLAGKVDLS